ncbi:MAG: MFS transporter [Actinomycetes bacterium]
MSLLSNVFPDDFRNALVGPVRRFFVMTAVSAVGQGLTMSLFVVYLHSVRHLSLGFTTALLSVSAVIQLVTSPFWGTMVDRFGPVRPMLLSLIGDTVGLVFWGFASTTRQAAIAMAIMALFAGGSWGPAATLLTRIAPSHHLQRAFGLNFMLVNLGIGFGGLVSASIVNIHRPSSFSTLYLLNAGVFAAGGVIVATLWRYGQAVPKESVEESHRKDGWSVVLRDRRLVHFVLASLILLIAGYGSQEAGFSLFVIDRMQLPMHDIGIIFFFNTSTIVVAQLFALNFIDGRSRTRVMSGVGVLWAIFWFIVLGAAHVNHTVALISMCVGMVIFAIGETAWSPVGPALVNEIAPEHLRGRYNAASSLTWSISSTLSPMITGLFLGSSVADFWPLCVALLALIGSLLALSLRRSLSPEEDGRTKTMS